jgi:predicted DNA-binding transcriptional regulator AlpA
MMKRGETPCYSLQHSDMPVLIEDIRYYTAGEITKELGISRTTLWRWRSDRKIPAGRLYRGGTVVFTGEEFDSVRAFANRLEPVQGPSRDQMNLFNGSK